MARKMKTMDGNTAAAHVAYAFTDVAGIYPITPSSVMAEVVDKWSADGRKNIFGQQVKVVEMQSEAGASGTVHGSLAAGALTTTFTASQGLLLMIPNMYKMAGELLPGVIHCSARALASHALSIFGDHQDVMACRQTGFAMLASTNPQEVMDLAAVAHLAAIKGRVPFLHFFDGFRTSHEIQKIAIWDYETLAEMADMDAIDAFRKNALNPEHPVLRGTAQNPDIYFQAREACNQYYNALPEIVEGCMNQVNAAIGSDYKLFNYYGAPDAENVIVAIGSVNDTIEETIDYLTAKGEKVGLVKVRLYRPFATDRFLAALPKTVKRIAVLDRTKEPGALGEPLYLDVAAALASAGRNDIQVVGGRYGLGSKDTTPGCVIAVYDNLKAAQPKTGFTVGIEDDVTHHSLPVTEHPETTPAGTVSCKFWGLGSDGTVGANKNSIKIIGDHTDKKVQAYFAYDSKKSGGVTISHLRFGDKPIKSTYYVSKADFVACHNPSYVDKYDITADLKEGGTFLLNCNWSFEELDKILPAKFKRDLATKNVKFYTVDGFGLAKEIGLGNRINMILQSAFFKLAGIIPIDEAMKYMKDAVVTTYGKKGDKIVAMNQQAIDKGVDNLVKIDVPAAWANAQDAPAADSADKDALGGFVENILRPINSQLGDKLPVSTFAAAADGTFPLGSAAYEKRGIAVEVPRWISENCIQCNQCSYVCPHAVIRPAVMTEAEAAAAPAGMQLVKMNGKGCESYKYSVTISQLDCTGCGVCANACPAKEKALVMKPLAEEVAKQDQFDYARNKVAIKTDLPFKPDTVKGSQFKQPLLEYSGACAGCGETPYARLVTQLFGERMYIANATGCSSIWGGSAPSVPYTTNHKGFGPSWANSLFEDNAEYGYGMYLGSTHVRERLAGYLDEIYAGACDKTKAAIDAWKATYEDGSANRDATDELIAVLEGAPECPNTPLIKKVLAEKEFLAKKSVWIFGGDGWAYDIGFGGLDHVLASGRDVNILVFDTEVYSNTGGQASKATPTGSVAQFAAAGKETKKKSLAEIAMTYGYVYTAQVCMGADYNQCIKALSEAESYHGPSLVIAYAPCINHGIRKGMGSSMLEAKAAVAAGYWNMFRFDPRNTEAGKNPFTLDSKEPTASYKDFILGEVRYSSLQRSFPERAEVLFESAEETAKQRYEHLKRLSDLYSVE